MLAFACTPEDPLTYTGTSVPHFTASAEQLYLVSAEEPAFTIEVGVTNQTGSDQSISISVDDDNTTAIADVHYTLSATSVSVPNGSYVASFTVTGNFDQLGADGDRVLTLEIANPSEGAGDVNQTITIVLSQFCEYNINDLAGDYTVLSGFWADGDGVPLAFPVTVEVADAAANQLRIVDMYDALGLADGDSDIIVTINQDGPLDFSNTVAKQKAFYATSPPFGAEYGDLSVEGGGGVNTCGELELTMEFTVAAGTFGSSTELLIKN